MPSTVSEVSEMSDVELSEATRVASGGCARRSREYFRASGGFLCVNSAR